MQAILTEGAALTEYKTPCSEICSRTCWCREFDGLLVNALLSVIFFTLYLFSPVPNKILTTLI